MLFKDPMVPFQRPDDSQLQRGSWMHDVDEYEMVCDPGIPTMITWCHGGKHVAVEGSWDNWKAKYMILSSFCHFFLFMTVLASDVQKYVITKLNLLHFS